MDLRIASKNIEIDTQSENYIRKKFERLQGHMKLLTDAKLEVRRTAAKAHDERNVAQMTLGANGYVLRGQERGLNLYAAVDAVADVMDRQIAKFKGKVYLSEAKRQPEQDPCGRGCPGQAVLHEADVHRRRVGTDGASRALILPVLKLGHERVQRRLPPGRPRLRSDRTGTRLASRARQIQIASCLGALSLA